MSHLKLFNRCTMHDISVALTVTVPVQGAAQVALKVRTQNYPSLTLASKLWKRWRGAHRGQGLWSWLEFLLAI